MPDDNDVNTDTESQKTRGQLEAELRLLDERRAKIEKTLAGDRKVIKREVWDRMTPQAQHAHIKNGGTLID